MPHTRTAEELKKEASRVLGEPLGSVFHELTNEYYWLRLKWQEFLQVFGSADRVEILNAAAPEYFQMLQDVLSDDILMHLTRLLDPRRVSGKNTLTFRALPGLLAENDAELDRLLQAALEDAAFARDWRNRRLAHRNLEVAIGHAAEPLAPATRHSIDQAISSLYEILNHLSHEWFNVHLDPEVVEAAGGAEALLYVLRDGARYKQEQLSQRSHDEDELPPLPPL
jgi:hypothetical protein